MIIRPNGYRYAKYVLWNQEKHTPYDYERFGLLNRVMSNVIVNSKSNITQSILMFFEKSMVELMKYTDVLKNFKNIHWKNR